MIPEKFEDLNQVKILIPFATKINLLIDELNKIKNAQTKGGIEWSYADKNLIISYDPSGSFNGSQEVDDSYSQTSSGSTTVVSGSHPFQLTGFVSGSTAYISVFPGSVNNAVPFIGANSIAAIPPPLAVVTGTDGLVWIKATLDASLKIVDLEIDGGTTVPTDTTLEKYLLIGTWTSSGGEFTSVYSMLRSSQTLYICNGTAIWEDR